MTTYKGIHRPDPACRVASEARGSDRDSLAIAHGQERYDHYQGLATGKPVGRHRESLTEAGPRLLALEEWL